MGSEDRFGHSEVDGGRVINRQHGDSIRLFYFFQNKESRLIKQRVVLVLITLCFYILFSQDIRSPGLNSRSRNGNYWIGRLETNFPGEAVQ
jgi:hypothetical protein